MFKVILSFWLVILFTSCHVGSFFSRNLVGNTDFRFFETQKINSPKEKFYFEESKLPQKLETVIWDSEKVSLDDFVEKSKTDAFLIIRDDKIIYENYSEDFSDSTIISSFSVAKSYVSALIGIAIDEGVIKSENGPITNYLSFSKKGFDKVTIKDLLLMRSGIRFNERVFNPFGGVNKFYYGRNLDKYCRKLKVNKEADSVYDYSSANTQLLGMILEKATSKNVATYLEEKIWGPLGMESDASWSLDSKRHQNVKAFCCLNAVARDHAKFARLFLNKGYWNGKQIISESWVKKCSTVQEDAKQYNYTYHWKHVYNYHVYDKNKPPSKKPYWVKEKGKGKSKKKYWVTIPYNDFFAKGYLGQFVYIQPDTNTIVVRIGRYNHNVNWVSFIFRLVRQF